MRRFFEITGEIVVDAIVGAAHYIGTRIGYVANIVVIVLPYVMYYVGSRRAPDDTWLHIGPEMLVPVAAFAVAYYFKSFANKIGKGSTCPVPSKRFTEVDGDGEVSVSNARLQEMLLYVADVEDWLERKGMLR